MAKLLDDLPTVHLAVSEVRLARNPVSLQTVLGSCVAAVFWSPSLRIGAMCHAALPLCPEKVLRGIDLKPRLRYVDFAIRYLLSRLESLGARRSDLQVKLFGGADVLPLTAPRATGSVGSQNCFSAIRTLQEEGIGLTASDLGGKQGRVIYFRTDTGEVLLRRLSSSDAVDADNGADIAEELGEPETQA
jgi:chemotaxis protein CheD